MFLDRERTHSGGTLEVKLVGLIGWLEGEWGKDIQVSGLRE